MPFFSKKGGKNKKANRLCSYEDIVEDELPLLHNLIYNFAKTAKIKSCIAKTDDINKRDSFGRLDSFALVRVVKPCFRPKCILKAW